MAYLSNWLDGALALPQAIESKFTMLPKVTPTLMKFDNTVLPAGPNVYPAPPAFPVPDLSKLPALPGTTSSTSTASSRLPLSPTNPGAGRGDINYGPISRANLPLSPTNPGAARGTIDYS